MTASRPVNPKAYELFMLGRYHYWQGNRDARKQAVAEFEEAIRLQPDYALAHASLAMAQTGPISFLRSEESKREAAQKAIELDPSLAEGHAALAGIKFDDWDWAGTLAEFEKGLELNPVSIDICGCYGNVLAAFGRFDEAIRIVERAILANPLSAELRSSHGFVLHLNGRYAEAERALKRAIDLEPRHVVAHIILAQNYVMIGRLQDALATADRPELQADGTLGSIYAALGRRDDALKVLARIDPASDPLSVSLVQFALGDSNRGFEYLTKAVERRQGPVRWLNVWPFFDNVRSDPRLVSLVARLNLPDPPLSR